MAVPLVAASDVLALALLLTGIVIVWYLMGLAAEESQGGSGDRDSSGGGSDEFGSEEGGSVEEDVDGDAPDPSDEKPEETGTEGSEEVGFEDPVDRGSEVDEAVEASREPDGAAEHQEEVVEPGQDQGQPETRGSKPSERSEDGLSLEEELERLDLEDELEEAIESDSMEEQMDDGEGGDAE